MVEAASGGGGGSATSGIFYNITSTVVSAATSAMIASTNALSGQVGAQQVKYEAENLQQFKNKVDAILQDLDGSPASHTNISQAQLRPDQLGSNFGQAADLANAYNTVHANLEQLSKTLALQIQSMSMSIDMANRNAGQNDEQQRAQFQSLLQQTADQSQAPLGGAGGGGATYPGASGGGTYAAPATYAPPAASGGGSSAGTTQGSY